MLTELYTSLKTPVLIEAAIIVIGGIIISFLIKHLIRKSINKFILKKVFKKDINLYETSILITKITTEILQWLLILIFINYAVTILGFSISSNLFSYIKKEIPKITIFIIIILVGVIISKIVASSIKRSNIENNEKISLLAEIIIDTAFILSALEYTGIKATAILETFKVVLYVLGAIIIILIIKPELLKTKT